MVLDVKPSSTILTEPFMTLLYSDPRSSGTKPAHTLRPPTAYAITARLEQGPDFRPAAIRARIIR